MVEVHCSVHSEKAPIRRPSNNAASYTPGRVEGSGPSGEVRSIEWRVASKQTHTRHQSVRACYKPFLPHNLLS